MNIKQYIEDLFYLVWSWLQDNWFSILLYAALVGFVFVAFLVYNNYTRKKEPE